MGQVSSQLSLPIGLKDTESFASFIPGQNAQACSHLNALFSQLQNKKVNNWLTYLFSDSGLGKSHLLYACLLYTSPSPRDRQKSRMPSSA